MGSGSSPRLVPPRPAPPRARQISPRRAPSPPARQVPPRAKSPRAPSPPARQVPPRAESPRAKSPALRANGPFANPVIHNPPVSPLTRPYPGRLAWGRPPGSGGGCSEVGVGACRIVVAGVLAATWVCPCCLDTRDSSCRPGEGLHTPPGVPGGCSKSGCERDAAGRPPRGRGGRSPFLPPGLPDGNHGRQGVRLAIARGWSS